MTDDGQNKRGKGLPRFTLRDIAALILLVAIVALIWDKLESPNGAATITVIVLLLQYLAAHPDSGFAPFAWSISAELFLLSSIAAWSDRNFTSATVIGVLGVIWTIAYCSMSVCRELRCRWRVGRRIRNQFVLALIGSGIFLFLLFWTAGTSANRDIGRISATIQKIVVNVSLFKDANGRLPEDERELVQFLGERPSHFARRPSGNPIRYQLISDDRFIVFSILSVSGEMLVYDSATPFRGVWMQRRSVNTLK